MSAAIARSGALLGSVALTLAPFIVLFALWETSARLGWVTPVVLPAPSAIATRLATDLAQASLRVDALYTLTEVLAGFAIASVLGLVVGGLVALVPWVDRMLSPLIVAMQTVPKVAVAPVLVIWFGFGIEAKIVLVALIDFFPILVNAVAGFRNTDPRQLQLMKALGASSLQVFWKVRLFNAMPFLAAGMHIAIVLSVIGAVLGEFLGSARGLGSQIVQRQGAMDIVGVFSILVLLSLLGVGLNLATHWAARRMVFWTRPQDTAGI